MAAADCSKTPRSKSIKAKPRALTLRDYEARKLAQDGRVLIVREVKPQPPALCRYEMNQSRTAALCLFDAPELPGGMGFCPPTGTSKDHRLPCPLGPVGSPLWGRETYMLAARDPDERDWQGDGKLPGVESRPHIDWYGNPALAVIFRTDGEHVSDTGVRMAWRSPVEMPALASRFPRLRHESCDVKRAQQVTENEAHESGAFFATHVLYNGALTCDDWRLAHRNVLEHYSPGAWDAETWLWCSLVVDLDRLEVADA